MRRLRGAALALLLVRTAAKTPKTNMTRSLAAVVEDAMKASVKQYAQVKTKKDAQRIVRDIFSAPSKEEMNLGKILILNGRVFANRHEGKVYGHLVNTARALKERNDVGNLAYLHESGASGRCVTNKDGKHITDLPTTLIARDGYSADRCGVLVPNPYFGNLDHRQREDDRLLRAAELHEYDARTPRAFWRGHLRQLLRPDGTAPHEEPLPGGRCPEIDESYARGDFKPVVLKAGSVVFRVPCVWHAVRPVHRLRRYITGRYFVRAPAARIDGANGSVDFKKLALHRAEIDRAPLWPQWY